MLIEKLSHEGRGIAHHEGRVVFVDQALPGENVRARFTSVKGNFAEAVCEEVLLGAAERVEPICPHFTKCGGCSLQHMSSAAQLAFKEDMVHEKLSHSVGSAKYERLEVISGPITGYRRKARLTVRYVGKKDRVMVGFREKHSSFIADMDSCAILDTQVANLLPQLGELVSAMNTKKFIPQIEVAIGDKLNHLSDCALVFRHLAALPASDLLLLEVFGKTHSLDIYLQPQGAETVHKFYPAGTEDRLFYQLPHFGLTFGFHPLDFTQVNAQVNMSMVRAAVELLDLGQDDKVLDLFCGLGNFTLAMATKASHVTGVEGINAMVERGQENALRNNIGNVTFLCADLTRPPADHDWLRQGFDKVLLDPPRSGALEVLPAVLAAKPKRIVYVSCNPATLARDASYLQEHGYLLKSAGAMDMFPHTGHVEALALFVPTRSRS